MVREFLILLGYALFIPSDAIAATPTVKAEVHPNSQVTKGKLEGILSVYHSSNQVIDTSQVLMDDLPLSVELVVESKITDEELRGHPNYGPEDRVTILRFELEGKPKGLYILPAISLPINGNRISTTPSTYDIQSDQAVASLRLETVIEPPGPYYPGQRARFGYRIFFDQPTELTSETLPLLSPEGFEKIGQEEIHETPSSLYTIQEIIQEVRARDPALYSLPASTIEGRNFREGTAGQRLPVGPVLRAETPPIEIEIRSFPKEGQPASFTGIIGPVALEVHLLSASTVLVGDELRLSVLLTHTGDLDQVLLPDLTCQPGFSGFFRFDDFPPEEQTNTLSKEFILTLRPLSTLITDS